MKRYVCLVNNRHDTHDRDWIKSFTGEPLADFRQRVFNCYGKSLDWQYQIFEVADV